MTPKTFWLTLLIASFTATPSLPGNMEKVGKQLRVPLVLATGERLQATGWTLLNYEGLPCNRVDTTQNGLRIYVEKSAAPLLIRLKHPTSVCGVTVKGLTSGLVTIPKGKRQGDKGADDYVLRLGLVFSGERRLGKVESFLAPKWVKQLGEFAEENQGIDHVEFLNLANAPAPLWESRKQPGSPGLIRERVAGMAVTSGNFSLNVQLPEKREVVGLWIVCDGDATGSEFQVDLTRVELLTDAE